MSRNNSKKQKYENEYPNFLSQNSLNSKEKSKLTSNNISNGKNKKINKI